MTPPIVKRYIIALDRHKVTGMIVFALISGLAGIVAIMPSEEAATSYEAVGVLRVTTLPTTFSPTGQQIQQEGTNLTEELLLADNVVEATATAVGTKAKDLVKQVELKFGGGDDDKKQAPSIIGVIYKDGDPEKAAKTVDVLMQKMVEQSRLVNSERLRAIIDSIETRAAEAKAELQEAQQELERYDRIEGAALAAAQDGTLLGSITGSQQQQRQLQLTLEGMDTQIASLENRLGLTADQAYTNSALSADPTIASLRSQIMQADTQYQMLKSQGYKDAHPNVAELLRQRQTSEKMLQQRATEVIGGNGLGEPLTLPKIRQDSNLDPARMQLANQLVALQTQRDTLRQQLVAMKRTEKELLEQYQKLPTKQLERMALQNQFTMRQNFYNTLQTSLFNAKTGEAETVSNLAVAQAPQVNAIGGGVEKSNPIVILAGGTFFGLVAAGGLIVLLAILDSKLYTAQEIQQVLAQQDVPILAELPSVMTLDPDFGQTGILLNPDSPYLEFYERFRSNLVRGENKSLKVVLVTSTTPGEGKTVTAYNLAIASAQAGKRTLLVEGDLRSPSQSKIFKVTSDSDARVQPLLYYSSKSGCIKLAPDIENLYIVPSPGPQRQAAAILESKELEQLLTDARGRFDFVVVDSPALSQCNDAWLLQPLTDGMVLVTRPGYSEKAVLTQTAEELVEAEPSPLLGAIINGVDKPVSITPVEEVEEIVDSVDDEEEESFEDEEDYEEQQEEQIPTGAMRF
ncbi:MULTISPECIES: GumC family protein [unclassified Coleofasciculus]|uniref:GumC family protein n=1 Tax=unclassified Coleofasciculus TaxID=2692782 RepID=UPI0018812D7A|nr:MULTISPECIES: polysaccharide biosynthesis tyrosine autokinase [unclassified Coleofasciculus]MBE9125877.1 polysaccharide biosynthesis tyrosine autokinase [Coleofasciculus sp. LEGE 07081]MBE9149067.1 polysaccharide biosynthesis tyrosine autokinase [Coleofasciculus sp. LEGE 07092]